MTKLYVFQRPFELTLFLGFLTTPAGFNNRHENGSLKEWRMASSSLNVLCWLYCKIFLLGRTQKEIPFLLRQLPVVRTPPPRPRPHMWLRAPAKAAPRLSFWAPLSSSTRPHQPRGNVLCLQGLAGDSRPAVPAGGGKVVQEDRGERLPSTSLAQWGKCLRGRPRGRSYQKRSHRWRANCHKPSFAGSQLHKRSLQEVHAR